MTHNMKIKYPFYISENPFIYSLFLTLRDLYPTL